ncbi:hypothetical protein QM467_01505 [Rhodoblastus sp. 17X3]|uniref:hypothetical protein n=1 Tax=Rhodoblastus sp. 17X3 TaxID=3047026 RepID=UPI0024B65717|nr:hypothetical protein [Rhodoblastus sp. 17X3]MDI9846730.1 hypothetical protein [Rhodoblastus sp. 17X3]
MTTFREALAPFAVRMAREHQVLHIAADLPAFDGAIEIARHEILKWAQKRSGGQLPADAMAGRNFDLLAAGRNSSAVEVELPEIHAWAFRQEDPDKTIAGRIWTSEAILWRTPDRSPRFAARLIVGSTEAELDVTPAVPGYIRQLLSRIQLTSGGHPLTSQPWFIGNAEAQDAFLDLLADPARRLPVVVFSATDRADPKFAIDLDRLAEGLCGLAYVVAILPETSWALTERFGKFLSVFDRGVRTYMPGFDEDADPYVHPLWLGARLATAEDAFFVERQIRMRVAQFSTRAIRMGDDILPFAQLRSISRKAEHDRLANSGASDAEQLLAAKARIAALEKERDEANEMQDYALEEERKAQTRAEEAESRERNATAQIQNLLQQLSDTGVDREQSPQLPRTWADFEEWCDRALVGRVTLTSAARRGCKKALFDDVEQAARCLLWLATTCRDRWLMGGGSLRDETVEEGIRNSPCGSDEFFFHWQARRLNAEWHIKTGGNTRAPESCLRIYYGWDDQAQQIIVADMPAHRRTGAS